MLSVAKRDNPDALDPKPAEKSARAARRNRHIRHLRDARIRRIEKLANALYLPAMPFADGTAHIVRIVAIRAREQLAYIDHHDLMPRPIGDEHALEAHMVVVPMVVQLN